MKKHAFTLIELLIVVTIIAILAAIALVNLRLAMERSMKSADMANMKVIGSGLQMYFVDYGTLPPADREAAPYPSFGSSFTTIGNGPAAGGSWDGVPWILVDKGYISDWRTLFNPKYLKRYGSGTTIKGDYPRFHNFRYAYNASAISSGGVTGGTGNINSGEVWILRNLWIDPEAGWYGSSYPNYPADYDFPWSDAEYTDRLEHVLFADMAVKTVVGGTDEIVR